VRQHDFCGGNDEIQKETEALFFFGEKTEALLCAYVLLFKSHIDWYKD